MNMVKWVVAFMVIEETFGIVCWFCSWQVTLFFLSDLKNSSMADSVGTRLYSCFKCQNHLARHDDIVSKNFQSRSGRAFLFSHVMNIVLGPKQERQLITGLHTIVDVYCNDCGEILGWKYEKAYEESQRYKEGKFILEKYKIDMEN